LTSSNATDNSPATRNAKLLAVAREPRFIRNIIDPPIALERALFSFAGAPELA
jgi:hypothetical protein